MRDEHPSKTSESLTLQAVGDLSFKGRFEAQATERIFANLESTFSRADLVIGNLESPLVPDTAVPVPFKCSLRGAPEWAGILKKCGIGLVTLANNHMMDFGSEGLFATMASLDKAGISYVGAGKDLFAARRPMITNISGRNIAFLGRSAVEVSSPCYAESGRPGVAELDQAELLESIRRCRDHADAVIVMLHWGMEYYLYPSPRQRQLAANIVSAGADVLLGHHPHVLQGDEMIDGALVSYSSGNFLFDEFPWSITIDEDQRTYDYTLSEENRQGIIFEITMGQDGTCVSNRVFTRIPEDVIVTVENTRKRQRQYQRLRSRLHLPLYGLLWKLYSIKREWDLRFRAEFSPVRILRRFYRIRPKHLKDLMHRLRRSARISSGKSTNPYE